MREDGISAYIASGMATAANLRVDVSVVFVLMALKLEWRGILGAGDKPS